MSGTNWSSPVVTDTIVNYTAYLISRDVSAMTQMRSSLTADTNIPTSTIRWNDTNFKWESWSGTAWGALATTYGISISGNAGSASAVAWGGVSGKPTTVAGYGITDINTTYAPTKTGGGASGTWGINISGAAGSANSVTWTNVGSKPTTVAGYGITDVDSYGNPVGTIIDFAGTAAPAGYLACPLTATNISRTTYAALFAAIDTTWGAGDGSTTFGMPWFPANYAAVQANANIGTNNVGQVIAHSHAWGANYAANVAGGALGYYASASATSTGSTGGAANLAAGVRVLKCVKI